MAILGMQAVMTLVMISVLEKICPIYSLGRWLLTGQKLVRYLHPSDEELKKAAGTILHFDNSKGWICAQGLHSITLISVLYMVPCLSCLVMFVTM